MSLADKLFTENCRQILDKGFDQSGQEVRPQWEDGSPAYTKKIFGVVNRYDLSKEFPILTIRPINYKAAIDELLWIWQRKSNNVDDLNSKIWDQWTGADNTIGKAYGYQMQIKHKYKEGMFDQVDRVLYDLKHNPSSRRIMTSMYNFEDLHEMNLYPCAYSMTFNISSNKLNAILNQRSQDMLVANGWNVLQYAVLVHMFAQVSDLQVGEFIHVISDAHIYDRHVPLVKKLIQENQYPAPKFIINKKIDDFYQFTPDDFSFENYQHGPAVTRIPVAI